MKTNAIILLCLSAGFIFSCGPTSKVEPEKKIVISKEKSLIIGNPFDCGIENMLIFLVGTNYKPDIFEGQQQLTTTTSDVVLNFCANVSGSTNDRYASTEYINKNENEYDIRNILFYDQGTKKSYPLITDTVHILSFALHKEFVNPLIFYRIVKKDINKDSLFNSSDPVLLFVSDIRGKNLKQITPDDQQFLDYFYYEKTNTILIKTSIDGNKDLHFTNNDETNFTSMDLKAPAMGQEIFTKSLKDSLRLQ